MINKPAHTKFPNLAPVQELLRMPTVGIAIPWELLHDDNHLDACCLNATNWKGGGATWLNLQRTFPCSNRKSLIDVKPSCKKDCPKNCCERPSAMPTCPTWNPGSTAAAGYDIINPDQAGLQRGISMLRWLRNSENFHEAIGTRFFTKWAGLVNIMLRTFRKSRWRITWVWN